MVNEMDSELWVFGFFFFPEVHFPVVPEASLERYPPERGVEFVLALQFGLQNARHQQMHQILEGAVVTQGPLRRHDHLFTTHRTLLVCLKIEILVGVVKVNRHFPELPYDTTWLIKSVCSPM